MSNTEFLQGIKNIQDAIIERLEEDGITVTAGHFIWNHGRDLLPTPDLVSLEINVQGRTIKAELNREQIEDSWDWAGHWPSSVRAMIRAVTDSIMGV